MLSRTSDGCVTLSVLAPWAMCCDFNNGQAWTPLSALITWAWRWAPASWVPVCVFGAMGLCVDITTLFVASCRPLVAMCSYYNLVCGLECLGFPDTWPYGTSRIDTCMNGSLYEPDASLDFNFIHITLNWQMTTDINFWLQRYVTLRPSRPEINYIYLRSCYYFILLNYIIYMSTVF